MSNCPVCGDVFDKALTEDGLTTYDHHEGDTIRTCEVLVDEANRTVPKEDLRELVEEWRETQSECDLPRSGLTNEGYAYKTCAEQLEEVLGDE